MTNSREFLECARDGRKTSGAMFIALLEQIIPRLEGYRLEQVTSDANLWAKSLRGVARLVESDVITMGWDVSIVAQACGVPMRWENDRPILGAAPGSLNGEAANAHRMPAFLETVRILCASADELARVVAIPGVCALAEKVLGCEPDRAKAQALKRAMCEIGESICKARPDMLVVFETLNGHDNAMAGARRACATLKNVAEYYRVPLAICLGGYRDASDAARCALDTSVDHLMIGLDAAGQVPDAEEILRAASTKKSIGLAFFPDDGEKVAREVDRILALGRKLSPHTAIYFITPGPVGCDSDLTALKETVRAVRQAKPGQGAI